jgi:hypothetical protein
MDNKYYTVKVEFVVEDDKGKLKKQKFSYLVDAMSVTEAEAKMTTWLIERSERDFQIKDVVSSPIVDVL